MLNQPTNANGPGKPNIARPGQAVPEQRGLVRQPDPSDEPVPSERKSSASRPWRSSDGGIPTPPPRTPRVEKEDPASRQIMSGKGEPSPNDPHCDAVAPCAWCGRSFEPVTRGDQRKLFCSTRCRMTFHRAARRWAEHQFFNGKVSAQELHAVSWPCTAHRLASESRVLPAYPSGQGSPAGAQAASGGISVLWAKPRVGWS